MKILKPSDIDNPNDFIVFAKQRLGVPHRSSDFATIRKQTKELFESYPNASWATLCRVVEYLRGKKIRLDGVHLVIPMYKYAFRDGYLPELDPTDSCDEEVEKLIDDALKVEVDPKWRKRLIGSIGVDARREVFELWKKAKSDE